MQTQAVNANGRSKSTLMQKMHIDPVASLATRHSVFNNTGLLPLYSGAIVAKKIA